MPPGCSIRELQRPATIEVEPLRSVFFSNSQQPSAHRPLSYRVKHKPTEPPKHSKSAGSASFRFLRLVHGSVLVV
ncbi:hypothetical protein HanIR_Chr15g0770111 [Helianthus annuus]|nr:hypothetical protein HanIR_Chr15g0770111 [Helianthus annuus]